VNRHKHHRRGPKGGIIYQFLLGFLVEVNGKAEWIDQCSQKIPGFEAAAAKEEKEKTADNELKEPQTKFQKILGYVGKGIDFICGFKDDIKTWIISKVKRYMRLFLQGKIRARRFKWAASELWTSVQTKAKDFGQKILDGAANVGSTIIGAVNFVCKTIDDMQAFLKEQIENALQPIYDLFEEIKAKFYAFLTVNPVIKVLYDLLLCLYENKDAIASEGFISPLKGFQARIKSLNTKEGWVNLVVDAICSWSDLSEAITFLKDGIAATNADIKYNLYGKFLGKFVNTLQLIEEEKKAK